MKKALTILLLVATSFMHVGCATLADAKAAKGTGTVKIYDHSKDVVWASIIEVINGSDLQIVTENINDGMILAQRSMTAFSYGENVAVFVEEINGKVSTKVEVVNKRALATNITSANWAKRIFKGLDAKLLN